MSRQAVPNSDRCIRVGTACDKGVWPFEAATRDGRSAPGRHCHVWMYITPGDHCHLVPAFGKALNHRTPGSGPTPVTSATPSIILPFR